MTSALCQTERQTVSQTGGREIADDSFKTAKNGSVRVTAVKIPHAGGVVNELKLSLVYFQIKRLAEEIWERALALPAMGHCGSCPSTSSSFFLLHLGLFIYNFISPETGRQ